MVGAGLRAACVGAAGASRLVRVGECVRGSRCIVGKSRRWRRARGRNRHLCHRARDCTRMLPHWTARISGLGRSRSHGNSCSGSGGLSSCGSAADQRSVRARNSLGCAAIVHSARLREDAMTRILPLIASVVLTACYGGKQEHAYEPAIGGDAARGAAVIRQADCGSCHTIPGIRAAEGVVGPPLYFFSRRTYIAGELPNTPTNLVRWIIDPRSVEPGTAMPRLGLSEQQARDVAAYLYTLH